MTAYPCLRCGGMYEQAKRRASHFCPPCRIERNREQDRENMRRRRALARDVRHDLDTYRHSYEREHDTDDTIEALMGIEAARAFATVEEYAQSIDEGDLWALVPDTALGHVLGGANTAAGPNEGTSTYFYDLADQLDAHAREVAQHPWFAENPHWSFALHDADPDLEHLEAA